MKYPQWNDIKEARKGKNSKVAIVMTKCSAFVSQVQEMEVQGTLAPFDGCAAASPPPVSQSLVNGQRMSYPNGNDRKGFESLHFTVSLCLDRTRRL